MSSSEELPNLIAFSPEGTGQHLKNTILHTKHADIYSVSKNMGSGDWLDLTAVISVMHTVTLQSRSTSSNVMARSHHRAQPGPPFLRQKKQTRTKRHVVSEKSSAALRAAQRLMGGAGWYGGVVAE